MMRKKKKGKFAGNKKVGGGLLSSFEKTICDYIVPRFPKMIETYHLTYMTVLWSAIIILSGYLAQENLAWLWLSSFGIFMQYVTDLLDGKIGKYRDTGLIKWGFFMDHFLDYVFMSSVLIAYAFLIPGEVAIYTLGILAVFGAFMLNSFLAFSATNEFKIHYFGFGPTEARIAFVLLNTSIIYFGSGFLEKAIPYILLASLVLLIVVVYRKQKYIWKIDESEKGKEIK